MNLSKSITRLLIVLSVVVAASVALHSLPDPNATSQLRTGASLKHAHTDNSLFEESSPCPRGAERPRFDGKGACSLSGTVSDQSGHPVVEHGIWIEPSTLDASEYFQLPEPYGPAPACFTDAKGHYVIEGVGVGSWMIGMSAVEHRNEDPNAVAPIGARIEVRAGCSALERDLQAYRGLYIRGSIVDPRGQRVQQGFVHATRAGSRSILNDMGERDGTFVLGPLVPGRYSIWGSMATEYCESEQVLASPGDEGVVLTLLPGGTIAGMVEDAATGDVCHAKLTLSGASKDGSQVTTWWSHDSGDFNIDGLHAGSYDIIARTGERKVGFARAVRVREGETVQNLKIRLEPGCVVRVKCEHAGALTLRSKGIVVNSTFLEDDGTLVEVLLAGPASVQLDPSNGIAPEVQELDLTAGEEKEVVFGGK